MVDNNEQPGRTLYSGLRFLLEDRQLSVADLAQRIVSLGEVVSGRTLQRLADPTRPLRLVDTRILDAICRALSIELGDFLIFAPDLDADLRRLPSDRQARLDALMDAHTEVGLTSGELRELESLAAEADDLNFANTQRLVAHHEWLRDAVRSREHSAAD